MDVTKEVMVYKNTKTTLHGWVKDVHEKQPRGIAYLQDNYFIHIYGCDKYFWNLSPGLTVTQKKDELVSVCPWAENTFGAIDIKVSKNMVGKAISSVWRPGLSFDEKNIFQALSINEYEKHSSAQTLRVLLKKLGQLFLYIEPTNNGLKTYSHKTRELLILSCTEIENIWKRYMLKAKSASCNDNGFNTKDYVRLKKPLFLEEYEVKFKPYEDIIPIRPFYAWDSDKPTQSLEWYDAYNKTKHDRDSKFHEATLLNCINAIAGNIILFCIQYSPFHLEYLLDTNGLFEIKLIDPKPETFYIPNIALPDKLREELICWDATGYIQPWISNTFII